MPPRDYWNKPLAYKAQGASWLEEWKSVEECVAARRQMICTNHMVGQDNPKPLMGYERLFLSN